MKTVDDGIEIDEMDQSDVPETLTGETSIEQATGAEASSETENDRPLEEAATETDVESQANAAAEAGDETPPPDMDAADPTEAVPNEDDEDDVWGRILAQLEQELAQTDTPEQQAALHHHLGTILDQQLGQTERAILHFQQAYAADPTHQPTLKAATRLFREIGQWDMVIELLEAQEESTLTDSERVDLLMEQASIDFAHLDKADVAIDRLNTVLEIDPTNYTALKLLEKFLVIRDDKEALTAFYNRYIYDANFAAFHLPMLLNLAQVLEESTDRQPEAIPIYQKIIELDPKNRLAISALKRLLMRHKRWDDLSEVYRHEEDITEEPKRKALIQYLQARLCADRLNDRERAEAHIRRALEIDPDNIMLWDELETVNEARRDWPALADVHERQYELAINPEKKLDIAFKLGALYQERLEDYEQAADWYEKALEAKMDYLPALHVLGKLYGRAGDHAKLIGLLEKEADCIDDIKLKAAKYFMIAEQAQRSLGDHERAVDAYRRVLELMPGYLPAIKALSELYGFLGRVDDLIAMNELQLSLNPSLNGEQFVYLLEKNASLWEHKGGIDEAIDCRRRILERHAGHISSIQALGRLYAKAEKWEELIEINEREGQIINDQHRIIALVHKSGEICEQKLDDEGRAVRYYKRVLTLSPSYLPTVKALGAIYQRQSRWDELITLYHRELESVGEGEQAISIRFKVAQIYDEELDNAHRAETHYRKILDDDPDFTPALHALTKLYQRENNHAARVELYEAQAEKSTESSSRLLALYKVAELYETGLVDMGKAESTYRRILDIDPNNLPARRGLFRTYAMADEREKQLDLLNQEIDAETEPERQLPLLIDAAHLYNEMGGNPDEAVKLFLRILDIEPANDMAFQQLERLYRQQRRFEELADLYEAHLSRIESDDDKMPLLRMLIDVLENHLGDFDRLLAVYREFLRIEPLDSTALDFFEEVYAREHQWDALLDVYDRMRQISEDKTQLLHLYLVSGQILELELKRYEEALKRYESALELEPESFLATEGAKRVYARLEHWSALSDLLEKNLENAASTSTYIVTAYHLAFLKEGKFGRLDEARQLYVKVLDLDPAHKDAYRRAKKLLTQEKDFQTLVQIQEKRLGSLENDDERLDLHRQIAEVAENQLSDLPLAIHHRRTIVEKSADDVAAKRHLADLLAKNAEWEEAIALYEELAPKLDDAEDLRSLHFEMGHIYQKELGNHSRAVSAFETVLAYEPDDLQAMERLGDLYKELHLSEEACEILQKLLAHELPKEKAIRYNLTIGEILLDQMSQEEEALPYFDRALELDPSHPATVDLLSALFERLGRWERLVELYEQNIDRLDPNAIDQRTGLMLGLSRIYVDKIGDVEKALAKLETAHRLDHSNTDIQAAQARVMGMNALYYLDAIDKHHQLLRENPFRVESYRELSRIYTERNEQDKAFCSLSALDFLKALTQDEAEDLYSLRDRVPGGIAAVIPEREQERLLVHPAERGLLRDIFRRIEPALYKLEPVDMSPYDLPNCKVAGVNSSIYHLMENAAYQLGVDLFKIYISQKQPDLLGVENTKPPTIVMGGNLAFAKEGIKRFLAGMVVSRIANGHVQFVDMPSDRLRYWAELTGHLYIPEIPVHSPDAPDGVEKWAARLNRAIPKPARKNLEESARQMVKQETPLDYDAFKLAMRHSDNRMGLLLAGDLTASAESLVYLDSHEPYRTGAKTCDVVEAFSSNDQIKELLLFSVSEEYFELRRMVHLNVE